MSSEPMPTATSSQPLRIEGLVKRFGKLAAVDGVTLELNKGECLGLLGPNGAGKSTLIRSIVGRVVPDAGPSQFLVTLQNPSEREWLSDGFRKTSHFIPG